MKKLVFYAAVLATLFATVSCNKELETALGGDTRTVFTVSAADIVTKADGQRIADGTNINALHWEIYLTSNAAEAAAPLGEGVVVDKDGDKTFTVDLNLVADQKYTIIFWAQVCDYSSTDGLNGFYDVTDLRNVKIDYKSSEPSLDDETRAAFFAKHEFNTENGPVNEDIYLKRPFSQLNLGATNLKTDLNNVNNGIVVINSTEIKVTDVAATFNTLEGRGTGDKMTLTYKRTHTPYNDYKATHLEVGGKSYHWLSMNYLTVLGEADNVDLDIKVHTTVGTVQHDVVNVPIKENHRTNILGDLLTTSSTFEVIVDEVFLKPDKGVSDAFLATLSAGGVVELFEDTAIAETSSVTKDVTINLNGHTLSYTGTDAIMSRVQSGATLTFNGPGAVVSDGYVASANAGGKIVVNSGDYSTSSTTLFQANGGKVEVYGGTFVNDNEEYGATYLLNHIDKTYKPENIVVYGGTFTGFNPADSHSENPAVSFLAPGYKSVETPAGSGVWVVVPDAAQTQTDVAAGKDVSLYADLTVSSAEVLTSAPISGYTVGMNQNGGTIDGNGNVITVEGTNTLGVVTSGGTIKDVVLEDIKRAVYVQNAKADVVLDGVVFRGDVGYALNTGSGNDPKVTISATDCHFIGWTSYSGVASASFENCTFGMGSYWQSNGYPMGYDCHLKPYVTTVLTGCDFCEGFVVDLEELTSGAKVTFENCTVGGVALTDASQLEWDSYSADSVEIK